jgi:transmembrane protein 18
VYSLCPLSTLSVSIVLCAEYLNDFGKDNWKEFATQNYFDKNGVFVTLFVSTPLIAMSLAILLYGVKQASTMLIKVKRLELSHKHKNESNAKKTSGRGKSNSKRKKNKPRAETKKQR